MVTCTPKLLHANPLIPAYVLSDAQLLFSRSLFRHQRRGVVRQVRIERCRLLIHSGLNFSIATTSVAAGAAPRSVNNQEELVITKVSLKIGEYDLSHVWSQAENVVTVTASKRRAHNSRNCAEKLRERKEAVVHFKAKVDQIVPGGTLSGAESAGRGCGGRSL